LSLIIRETYKILIGLDGRDAGRTFSMLRKSRSRGGHSLKNKGGGGQPLRTEMRKNFFTQRVVNLWNCLPQKAVGGQFVRYVLEGSGRGPCG